VPENNEQQTVPLGEVQKKAPMPKGSAVPQNSGQQTVPLGEVQKKAPMPKGSVVSQNNGQQMVPSGAVQKKAPMPKGSAVPQNSGQQMVPLGEAQKKAPMPKGNVMPQKQTVPLAAMKKKKSVSRYFFFIALAIPTLCAFLYFTFLASPMYISQASFAVRKADGNAPAASGITAAMLGSSGGLAGTDPFIINDYIQSLDIVQDIDRELNLVKHYTARSHDVISRLWQKPTQDELLKYWRWIMVPQLSRDTGIISVEARAYSPEMAQKIAQAVLVRSEALVNAMNDRSRNDAVELAHKEVQRAEGRVKTAQVALKEFRDMHATLDPKTTAAGLQDIVVKLETEATTLRTKIAETSSYMRPNTPVLKAYRQRLAAVEEQLAREKQRVAGTSAAQNNISSLVGDYEELSREAEFAQQQLVSAMGSLETARVQQATQSRYVVAYQQPTLPDESLYPRPLLFTLYTFLGTLITLGLLSLIWASIREHAGF